MAINLLINEVNDGGIGGPPDHHRISIIEFTAEVFNQIEAQNGME